MKTNDPEHIGEIYTTEYNKEEKEQVHVIHNDEYNLDQFSRREANNYAEQQ